MLYQMFVFLLEYLNFAFISDVPDFCCFYMNDPNYAFLTDVPKICFLPETPIYCFYLNMYTAVECEDLPPYLCHEGVKLVHSLL